MPLAETVEISEHWARPASRTRRRNAVSVGKPEEDNSGCEDGGEDSSDGENPILPSSIWRALLREDENAEELARSGMLRWRNHEKFKGTWVPPGPSLIVLGQHGMDGGASGEEEGAELQQGAELERDQNQFYEAYYKWTESEVSSSDDDEGPAGSRGWERGESHGELTISDVGGCSESDVAMQEQRRRAPGQHPPDDVLLMLRRAAKEEDIVAGEEEPDAGGEGGPFDFWGAVMNVFGGAAVWNDCGAGYSDESDLSEFSWGDEDEDDEELRDEKEEGDADNSPLSGRPSEDDAEKQRPDEGSGQPGGSGKQRNLKRFRSRRWMKKILPKPIRKALIGDSSWAEGQGEVRGTTNFLANLKPRELRAQLQVAKPTDVNDPIPKEARLWKDDQPRWY